MDISYRSDLYIAGRDEDGEAVSGHVFYVVAELDDGSRYAHCHRFRDTSWVDWDLSDLADDDEGPDCSGYYDCRTEEAEAACAALAARVAAGG